jgi:hypothetical protein
MRRIAVNVIPVTASCDDGDVATGGGYAAGTGVDVILSAGSPVSFSDASQTRPTGWVADFANHAASPRNVNVYAVCQHTE